MHFKTIEQEGILITQCTICGVLGVEEGHQCDPTVYESYHETQDRKMAEFLEKKIGMTMLLSIGREIFLERIKNAEAIIEKEFVNYDLLSKKGASFAERSATLNLRKIEWMKNLVECKRDAAFLKARPFNTWVCHIDFYEMRRKGIREFIRSWYEMIFYVDKPVANKLPV